jgi:hypothetical protein
VHGVGIRYGRGRGVTATSGGFSETQHSTKTKKGGEIPWLKVMIAIILIVALILLFLVMGGYPV